MDPKSYERIGDLLMQIRKKYAEMPAVSEENMTKIRVMLAHINSALLLNDEIAELDGKGWLR
jgi:hypothetical protein